MKVIAIAVLSIFSLIIIGQILRAKFYKSQKFWDILDSLTYFVFMPSMLFYKIATAEISAANELVMGFSFVFGVLLFLLFILVILDFFVKFNPAKFTSLVQGSIRYNTYIFLAIISSVFGSSALVIAAFLMAFMIPLINILVVFIFAIYVRNGKFSVLKSLKNTAKNPLVIACVAGLLANFINLEQIYLQTFKILGSAAITTGLISIGAGLKFGFFGSAKFEFILSAVFKLLLYPLLVFTLCKIFALNSEITAVCVIFSAMPTATSSYILAKQLGGDKELMSLIVTLQTLISPFTIWLVLFFTHAV